MTLKEQYKNTRPVGVYPVSNFCGLAILECCGDYVVSAWDFGDGYKDIRRSAVHYTNGGRAYIRKRQSRYYLDQIARV